MTSISEFVSLGSVTKWMSGGTPNRENELYWNGNIPWISAATLKRSHIRDSDQHLTERGVRAGSKLAPVGAILILVRGMALHRETRIGIAVRSVSFNQDVKALIPKQGVLSAFLLYALQARSSQILDLVSQAGSGTGVLDTELLQRLLIWLPDMPTQRGVVEVIGDTDRLIASLENIIDKKQAIKQGMMQQLLTGRTRLPGFSSEWAEVRLGDHAGMSSGGTPSSGVSAYYDGGVPWVSISDMTRCGKFVTCTEKTLSPAGLANSPAKLYSPDVVLYAMYASLGECAIAVGRVASSQAILGIAAGSSLDRDFLYYRLSSMKAQVRKLGQQGAQSNLNAGMVRNFRFLLPDIDEQRRISHILSDADSEIESLEARLAKARSIKVGMMQELLTGRTRLPVGVAS